MMMGTLILTSKGVAGVPRATLVVLLATAATFNLPTEPIFVILGIDALMDMGRTMTNVVGNCLASAVIARWEGEFGTWRSPSEMPCWRGWRIEPAVTCPSSCGTALMLVNRFGDIQSGVSAVVYLVDCAGNELDEQDS